MISAFQWLKTALVTVPVLTYNSRKRDGILILNTCTNDVGVVAVFEKEQEMSGKVVNRVIAYESKTLIDSQRRYRTTKKELVIELVFKTIWSAAISLLLHLFIHLYIYLFIYLFIYLLIVIFIIFS